MNAGMADENVKVADKDRGVADDNVEKADEKTGMAVTQNGMK